MKIFSILFLLLIFLSCKKEPNLLVFKAGNINDVTVTNHDSTAQGDYQFPFTDYLSLDLDLDGFNDIEFSSIKQLSNHPFDIDDPYIYSVKVRVVNDIFSIAQIVGSEQTYVHYSEPVYDYDGTWPRETTTVTYSCDSMSNSMINPYPDSYTVDYLNSLEPITEELSWINNSLDRIIRKPKFETRYYEGNQGPFGGDSLIGFHNINDVFCQSMPLNNHYYIPFKKSIGSYYKYGWILLSIIDNNKITIYKSAIQNEYN